jgi:hypothetical protein
VRDGRTHTVKSQLILSNCHHAGASMQVWASLRDRCWLPSQPGTCPANAWQRHAHHTAAPTQRTMSAAPPALPRRLCCTSRGSGPCHGEVLPAVQRLMRSQPALLEAGAAAAFRRRRWSKKSNAFDHRPPRGKNPAGEWTRSPPAASAATAATRCATTPRTATTTSARSCCRSTTARSTSLGIQHLQQD